MNNLDEMAQWYAMSVHLAPYKDSDIRDAYKAGWNAKKLDEYTDGELRAELKRRYAEKKAADALKPRCRNCKHLMRETIGSWFVATRCGARTYKLRGRDTHYCVKLSGHCEKWEPKK